MRVRTLLFRKKRDNRISTDFPDYYLIEVKPEKFQTPNGERNLSLDAAKEALQKEFAGAAHSLTAKYEAEKVKYWVEGEEAPEVTQVPEEPEAPTEA